MGLTALLLAGLTLLCGAFATALRLGRRGGRHAFETALAQRDRALADEAASTRLVRLAAIELRATALTVLGHADKLRVADGAAAPVHANAIAAVTTQMLEVADDLQDHAVPGASSRAIRDQTLLAGPMLQDAIAAVAATLAPGMRHWRIAPELLGTTLIADRRALAQILLRVLANAARFTRDGDWIDIAPERTEDELVLVIADEGAGLATVPGGIPPAPADSRGIGLGLALARVLMEAHGGGLTVETMARIGTRVALTFPAHRAPDGPLAASATRRPADCLA